MTREARSGRTRTPEVCPDTADTKSHTASATRSLSRRRFLASGAASAAALWTPLFRATPGHAQSTCAPPPRFPAGIDLYQQGFKNWSGAIEVDDLWTCAPRNPAEVLTLADWAASEGYQLRPRGATHNWSPFHITADTTCSDKVVMVSTTEHLNQMQLVTGSPMAVRVQPGVLMEDMLGFLETHGLGFANVPAPGELTVGGVIAIDGHGAAVAAVGELNQAGKTFGSVSNAVLEITVVKWDNAKKQHVLKTYDRSHPTTKALIANLGRTFVTEIVLQAGANDMLRCQSMTDIPAAELFGAPGSGGQSFSGFIDQTGRAEAIWFAFTEKPWLKVWSIEPTKPFSSREVSEPYNYPFSDNIPDEIAELAAEVVTANPQGAEVMGPMMYNVVVAGLAATASSDIWGPAKNTQLYIRSTTMRVTANGYAVLTTRGNLQRVLHDFYLKYTAMIQAYQARDEYPANMPVEIRCTGIDDPAHVPGPAESPTLSAIKPDPMHPERDVVVWFDVLSLTFTPGKDQFFTELEDWFVANYDGSYASMRPEWSKGWAYTPAGAWTNTTFINSDLRKMHECHATNDGIDWAALRFNALDPHRIFSNGFIDQILP